MMGRMMRNMPIREPQSRNGRYEIKNASMVDLIRLAYGFDADGILGGPNWLEMDRFDVIAKEPSGATYETRKLMLQSLLADRFGLVVHTDNKPLPAWALTRGKTIRIKQAAGTEEAGCRPLSLDSGPTDGLRINIPDGNGRMTPIPIGPGATIQFQCRNITMAAFAERLPRMPGVSLGAASVTWSASSRVSDETGLKGAWNFDVRWSTGAAQPGSGERITVFEALDKQLGLKLEERQVPNSVLVVDKVSRTPAPNPPGVAEALPAIALPGEFEVADVKPSGPARGGEWHWQPGGRFTANAATLRFLVFDAFNVSMGDGIAGLPEWANTESFGINAKAPDLPPGVVLNMESQVVMVRALLADRFKMKYHTEDRQMSAYSLVSVKPKMTKADPDSRTSCRDVNGGPGAPRSSHTLTCRNITMAEFAESLQGKTQDLYWPVDDETGIEGGWDFTLTYSPVTGPPGGRGRDAPANSPVPVASDPTGGVTFFDAIQKQLGLKLEPRKRPEPVIVIDHIDRQPTEN
jgi:uncharacterized protein (TIGR03435 family)